MEIRSGHARDLLCRDYGAIRPGAVEGVGRIDDEGDVVPEVAGHAGRGLAAVVGRHSADGQQLDTALREPGVQVGIAVEGGVDVLRDEYVALDARTQVVAGLAGPEWGSG